MVILAKLWLYIFLLIAYWKLNCFRYTIFYLAVRRMLHGEKKLMPHPSSASISYEIPHYFYRYVCSSVFFQKTIFDTFSVLWLFDNVKFGVSCPSVCKCKLWEADRSIIQVGWTQVGLFFGQEKFARTPKTTHFCLAMLYNRFLFFRL